jgi:hypothetical protein
LPELQDPHGPGDADARRCDLGRGVHLRNRRSQVRILTGAFFGSPATAGLSSFRSNRAKAFGGLGGNRSGNSRCSRSRCPDSSGGEMPQRRVKLTVG